MGFPRDLIHDVGDRYIVDGDIVIVKATLEAVAKGLDTSRLRAPAGPMRQYSTTNVPGLGTGPYGYVPTIGIDLSAIDAENAEWATAIRGAMANWAGIPGAQVYFVEAPGTYTVTVTRGTCEGRVIACASFPTVQCWPTGCVVPGDHIYITQGHDSLSADMKLGTMTHEMGHLVGFRHTNWNNRVCDDGFNMCQEPAGPDGAVHIPGTPTSAFEEGPSDGLSVMNAVIKPWNGFSGYDRIAARYLFPGGSGPDPILAATETPTISWSPTQDASAYEVWYAQRQGCGGMFCWGPAPDDILTYVGTTTSTSFVDGTRTRTSVCTAPDYFTPSPAYRIKAVFPQGTKSNLGAYTSCW